MKFKSNVMLHAIFSCIYDLKAYYNEIFAKILYKDETTKIQSTILMQDYVASIVVDCIFVCKKSSLKPLISMCSKKQSKQL